MEVQSTHKCRIFLSYRGNCESQEFSAELFSYLNDDPLAKNLYGDVYYSPEVERVGNYIVDILPIMEGCRYFVLPLNAQFYDGFVPLFDKDGYHVYEQDGQQKRERFEWKKDEVKAILEETESVTQKEILAALYNDQIAFISVAFDGFEQDDHELALYFGNRHTRVSASKKLEVQKDKNSQEQKSAWFKCFMEIADAVRKPDHEIEGIGSLISRNSPNVWIDFKQVMEDPESFPFYQKLFDVKTMTPLNYAASSFISGVDVASIYKDHSPLEVWFKHNLAMGKIRVNIVLTDPHCYAAQDASDFKMYPESIRISKDHIILENMNKLAGFKRSNPKADLRIYLTRIALPYGIMMTEHRNSLNNHMKVDLYSPVIEHDGKRPSFYLQQKNPETRHMFNFFKDNILRVQNDYAYEFTGHPNVDWMKDERVHIIHRAKIDSSVKEHTREAFFDASR